MKLAYIGLGVMGGPMAGHLAKAGHTVTVYNRTRSKADAWVAKHGGRAAATPREAAAGAEIVFSCVGNADDVRSIATGADGAFHGMSKGAIFVDHTTTSAHVAIELERAGRERGIAFLDAPVSGGQSGAEQGILTVMVGGDAAAFERAQPVISHYARAVTLMGASGSGQKTKMVNQICVAGVVQSLSEAMAFALRAGLDPARVLST